MATGAVADLVLLSVLFPSDLASVSVVILMLHETLSVDYQQSVMRWIFVLHVMCRPFDFELSLVALY